MEIPEGTPGGTAKNTASQISTHERKTFLNQEIRYKQQTDAILLRLKMEHTQWWFGAGFSAGVSLIALSGAVFSAAHGTIVFITSLFTSVGIFAFLACIAISAKWDLGAVVKAWRNFSGGKEQNP